MPDPSLATHRHELAESARAFYARTLAETGQGNVVILPAIAAWEDAPYAEETVRNLLSILAGILDDVDGWDALRADITTMRVVLGLRHGEAPGAG